ncbi:hypothetical protein AMR76_16610 [Vibrio furnissii]|uniref:Uncharacterized protein n=1 Tax=Vibrio furnissii TaxID=29494 RepID=A0A0Q2UW72_VIBFU|nr:hypothetical protein AMR76_16610 [Vibrio furnissii]
MGVGIGMVNWSQGEDSDTDSGDGVAQLQDVTTDSQNSSGRCQTTLLARKARKTKELLVR